MTVNQWVDAVYVLSVRGFSDRIAHICSEMARQQIQFEFVFDFDPEAIDPAVLSQRFAASDLRITHMSLVLKHIESWRRCVHNGYRRILVFEDDAVLASDLAAGFAAAMREADRLQPSWRVYLGCGDNRHVGLGKGDGVLVPGELLSATDALVFDRDAAARRLAWIATHKIPRPADWLMREVDARAGVRHYWLRQPLVEQGSMNGLFASVLDDKRRSRGRFPCWMRFRLSGWWKRLRRDIRRPHRRRI